MNVAAGSRELGLSYANAEALKWIAFACMLVDHANVVFADRSWEWAGPIGRIAFPVFALLVARHLDNDRVLYRLALFGVVSTIPHMLALHGGGLLPLNILLTFWLAGVVLLLAKRGLWLPAVLAFVVGGAVVEYGWFGLSLVLACWLWWQNRDAPALVSVAFGMLALCLVNGSAWGFLAVPIVLAASWRDWRVPRVRHFFWIGYPAHLAVLAALVLL